VPLYLNRYTIGAIFFISSIIASGWLSYNYATNKVELAWANERIELDKATKMALVAVNEKNKLLADKLSTLNTNIDSKSEKIKVETVEVEKEVVKYVKEYVTGSCPVDDDRLRIKNRAIATTNEFAKPTINPVM
jgi:GTP-dependent phosphoenolpyruvate carboxykinase